MSEKFKIMDGNEAAAYAAYAFSEFAAVYPITPSTAMAEKIEKMALAEKKNIFGTVVSFTQMQSEAGVSGAIHGALSAGVLASTFTSSQGLLLMIPNMYKIAGEFLPCVIHVAARTVATHALSILGDHSDIYACRQTGWAMLCSNNPQEAHHLGAIAHLSAIKGNLPFLHFFDGFRTSHELQKIKLIPYELFSEMLDYGALSSFKKNALTPENSETRGSAQSDDVFFQFREASNLFYERLPDIVNENMQKINEKTGLNYKPFNYYGHPEAEKIIVAMGSVCETIEEVVDLLNKKAEKVGLIKVRLYRPFLAKFFLEALPKSVKMITVLNKTKECGANGDPLYLDVLSALEGIRENFYNNYIKIFSGRYGISSKDTTPGQIYAAFENMSSEKTAKKEFTIGINDDVTKLSLNVVKEIDVTPIGTTSCKFWGLGADGTVGGTKNLIKIIGNNTSFNVQGYFAYDSKKAGGLTISHLRFGKNPIKSAYYINKADFVACHHNSYIFKYDLIYAVKPKGFFLLNTPWSDEELEKNFSAKIKKFIATNDIQFFVIAADKIAKQVGLGSKISTILQTAFLKILKIFPFEQAIDLLKKAVEKYYATKGKTILKMNFSAIETVAENLRKLIVPENWKFLDETVQNDKKFEISIKINPKLSKFIKNIANPVNASKGNELPVSAFLNCVNGAMPAGSAAFEKREISVEVPKWNEKNCIQCNFCSFLCPHSVIRPAVLNDEELAAAPKNFKSIKMVGMPNLNFAIVISEKDCTGCMNCISVCPGIKDQKALCAGTVSNADENQSFFDYAVNLSIKPQIFEKFKETTVKGSQFKKPLLEFHGACAGCGETAYAKLVTQLFGHRMFIANATGCSSIWGASFPSSPYTTDENGRGPAWQNSLFEDDAEFGYGIAMAQKTARKNILAYIYNILKITKNPELKETCLNYIKTFDNYDENLIFSKKLVTCLKSILNSPTDEKAVALIFSAQKILEEKFHLTKKSVWIFGGDGWAYDIGFGGIDHILAANEDVNILVFDTEVYSNTGGQSSKATPKNASAKFSLNGKITPKKNLAKIAMTYGNVYVAQISLGANFNQCIKALVEAENYNGPSLIIGYSPCINHGIKGGMVNSSAEGKFAVESGHWRLFRFNPNNKVSPLTIDNKPPTKNLEDFMKNELRFL